ncbi:MAG: HD domain-containing protein [Planctomycetes bacterium]|nr:HD domain-containing protein [Planctomycetota bacterium]
MLSTSGSASVTAAEVCAMIESMGGRVDQPLGSGAAALDSTRARPSSGFSVDAARRERPRVLVVDDDLGVLHSLCGILEGAGFEVVPFSAAAEACTCLLREAFDLVVSDLYLDSDLLGYDVAAAARGREPAIPVILLTGRPSFGGAQEAVRSQVSEIVVKPVEPLSLIAACRHAIATARNERRQRRLEAQNRVLASVLPRAIEAKDPTTSGHAERVVCYTDTLAARCHVSESDRAKLRLASLLHDVGKIGIPESILTKRGSLTAEERGVIEEHPEMGRQILEPLEDSEEVRTWVYQHHERWDGQGYPNRLKGDEVALPGRILILAEVYDALAEVRSYKPAWENHRIVEFFRAQAGSHFEPDLAHMVADGLERQGSRFFAAAPGMLF